MPVLKDGELFIEHGVEVVDGEVVHGFHLFEERDSQIVVVFFECAVNCFLIGVEVVEAAETVFVHAVVDFFVFDGVDESAVLVTFGAGERIEDTLGE